MKRVKFIYKILPLLFVGTLLSACDNEIKDIPKVQEKLELTTDSYDITIDLDNPREVILTFDWTEARETAEDNLISYTTKLDVVGNNFGTSTAIINSEEEGIFSRSFTSEQLYSWLTERWKLPLTKPFTLEFRVVAQWDGGATFEAPEVRTIRINVAAVKEEVPVPEKVTLSGSSMNNAIVEIEKTLENENKYAALVNLKAGELVIPLVTTGDKEYYLNPKDGEGTLRDGEAEAVEQQDRRVAWNITTAGEYRIVIDFENSEVTIYSPAKALEPAIVTWLKGAEEVNTTVTNLWLYGGGTSWGWWNGNLSVSLADPQILIYKGNALSSGDGVKFVVYGDSDFRNNAYTFTNPLTADGKRQNLSLALDKLGDLHGGYDGETRNSYYKLPAGTNFIVFDLRSKTILAKKQ
ncbi:MAG: SusE domain-containing protein [Dysgonomonas sp.]